jgi:hypothetical protein
MNEDYLLEKADTQPEVFKTIEQIKNELFKIRENLAPILLIKEGGLEKGPPVGKTPLHQELLCVLEISTNIKRDISL